MSNSIELYSTNILSKAVGKKNIRLQRDFLYVVDIFKESVDDEENKERSIEIFCDLGKAVEKYEKLEGATDGIFSDGYKYTITLYQCYWDRSKKVLNKLLNMRSFELK